MGPPFNCHPRDWQLLQPRGIRNQKRWLPWAMSGFWKLKEVVFEILGMNGAMDAAMILCVTTQHPKGKGVKKGSVASQQVLHSLMDWRYLITVEQHNYKTCFVNILIQLAPVVGHTTARAMTRVAQLWNSHSWLLRIPTWDAPVVVTNSQGIFPWIGVQKNKASNGGSQATNQPYCCFGTPHSNMLRSRITLLLLFRPMAFFGKRVWSWNLPGNM